jgi:hypothetical protein
MCPAAGRGAKINYLTMLFISTLIACLLRVWGGGLVSGLSVESLSLCETNACYGVEAVYRISFALCLFYLAMAAFSTCSSCNKHADEAWFAKVGIFMLLLVAVWFLPDGFYDVYSDIAKFMSFFFLLFQILQLISGGYEWDAEWTERDFKKLYLGTCLVVYGSCIAGCVFMYVKFISASDPDSGDTCKMNTVVITSNLLLSLLYSLISITEWCDHGRLLPSAVVTLYCYWLTFSALLSDPTSCNGMKLPGGGDTSGVDDSVYLVLGIVWAAVSVSYAGWNAATNETVFGSSSSGQQGADEAMLIPSDEVDSTKKYTEVHPVDAPEDPQEVRTAQDADVEEEEAREAIIGPQFHLILALCSMYIAMLLTGWGTRRESDVDIGELDVGWSSYWIKISCMWVTSTLYTVKLFPDRDFS